MSTTTSAVKRAAGAFKKAVGAQRYGVHAKPFVCQLFCHDQLKVVHGAKIIGSQSQVCAGCDHVEFFAPPPPVFEDNAARHGVPPFVWPAKSNGRSPIWMPLNCDSIYGMRGGLWKLRKSDGGGWKTLFNGGQIGEHFQKKFELVTAREFHLNILDDTEGPAISEIELGDK